MGAGLDMAPGDIAFKCNFATLDPASSLVLRRRVDRRFDDEGPALCAALDGLAIPGFPAHSLSVKYATEHRCGVVVRGPDLTDAISGTDPLKDGLPLLPAAPLDASPAAALTAAVVNAASRAMRAALEGHRVNAQRAAQGKPVANVVLLRGCGCRLALRPFAAVHGMRAAMVAPTKIIAGLGMCAGMAVLEVPGTTGDYRTQFHRKAEAMARAMTSGGGDRQRAVRHLYCCATRRTWGPWRPVSLGIF
jgi:2,3-diphosphopglycerate-independent phosphoglycerate mutase